MRRGLRKLGAFAGDAPRYSWVHLTSFPRSLRARLSIVLAATVLAVAGGALSPLFSAVPALPASRAAEADT